MSTNVLKIGALLSFFLSQFSFAQTLKFEGLITDSKQVKLISATVQLKDHNFDVIAYGVTNSNGRYSLIAKLSSDQKVYLIASYLGFKKDTVIINYSTTKENNLYYNFVLQSDENQLDEINITAPKPTIQVVNDTTKYNVQHFTTADDRNLESVIKKMPGMEVSKDGTIYFKKKQISKVLLENDDLTGTNYKAITQNIKPELINEVQAIEHWVEDDLLKGIINSDDIVLNLTLKDKRKQKIIGGLDIAYGTDERNDLSTNLITFVNKTKAYAFIRTNNIGASQEDIFRLAGGNRRLLGEGKLINHQILTVNPFDGNALALNNSLSGSINSITRFTSAFKLSASIYGLRNKLYGYNNSSSVYYAPLNATTVDTQNQESNNQHYQADVNMDYLLAKNARFTAKFSYWYKPQEFNALAFSSYNGIAGNEIHQTQNDKLNNVNADLKYTFKSNSSTALIVNAKLAKNDVNQDYIPTSNLYSTISTFNGANSLLQTANTDNSIIRIDAQGLKKQGKNYFYLNFGGEYSHTSLNSNLVNNTNKSVINGFLNHNRFDSRKGYLASKYTYDSKKIIFQSFVKASLINQSAFSIDTTFVALEPEVRLTLKLNSFESMNLRYAFLYSFANPLDFYSQPILTDLRSIKTSLNRLTNYGTHSFDINYSNGQFSDNYLSFDVNANGQYSEEGFLTTNFFENTLYYSQKIPYRGMKSFSAGAGLQKFLPILSSKIAINYNPTLTNYYGRVVNEINNYTSTTHIFNATASTGFKLPVNFSFEAKYQHTMTRLKKIRMNAQSNFKYGVQSRYQITKTIFNLIDFNWYRLSGENYKLLNTEIQLNPTKGKFKYTLYGKNLLNVKSISNSFVSDVAETSSNTSILGRYFLGSISMSIK